MRRGIEFLTEIELGNAPPIEYVIKNIHIDEAELNFKLPVNAHQVAEEIKQSLPSTEQRLQSLKDDHQQHISYLNKAEHRLPPLVLPEPLKEIIDSMFTKIFETAWEDISRYDRYAEELRKKSRVLWNREPVQEARIAFYSDKIAMWEINTEFIDNVVLRMLRDIAGETIGINEFAKQTALKILLDAYG